MFGGYNLLKRGGLSKYVSYISVGKGRDMGLDSILGFEGKVGRARLSCVPCTHTVILRRTYGALASRPTLLGFAPAR